MGLVSSSGVNTSSFDRGASGAGVTPAGLGDTPSQSAEFSRQSAQNRGPAPSNKQAAKNIDVAKILDKNDKVEMLHAQWRLKNPDATRLRTGLAYFCLLYTSDAADE